MTGEAVVLKILEDANFSVNRWWIKVLARVAPGVTITCDLVFNTFEEANEVKKGYKFLT